MLWILLASYFEYFSFIIPLFNVFYRPYCEGEVSSVYGILLNLCICIHYPRVVE